MNILDDCYGFLDVSVCIFLYLMFVRNTSLLFVFQSEASEWRKVFFISIAFYLLSNLFYLLFISGDVQSWNEPEPVEGGGQYYHCILPKLLVFECKLELACWSSMYWWWVIRWMQQWGFQPRHSFFMLRNPA